MAIVHVVDNKRSHLAVVRAAAWSCALLGAVVYLNSLDCGLCFDDLAAVETNLDIRPNVSWTNLLWNDFWGHDISDKDSHKSYRPLCVASFRLNYMLHGLEPMGYHLVNVVLHAVVCYLYVQLCAVVFNTTTILPALVAGLLFATHPIHTEAVAGVVGRADLMAGLFYLSSMLLYDNRVSSSEDPGLSMATPLIFCLASSLSKEIGVASFIMCPAYEFFVKKKMTLQSTMTLLQQVGKASPPRWFPPFLRRTLLFGISAVLFLVCRILLNQGSPVFSLCLKMASEASLEATQVEPAIVLYRHNNPAMGFATPYRQLHWSYLVFYNLLLLLFPSHLSAETTMGTIPPILSLGDYRNILTLITLSVLALLAWRSFNTQGRCSSFALSLMVFPFLPASNLFFPVGFVVAERVLYVPSMGFSLLVALGLWRLHKAHPLVVKVMLAYLLLVHSCKTMSRNRAWYSSTDLFRAALVVAPNNGKMYNNLATKIDMAGNKSWAVQLFRQSVLQEPEFITGYMNLAFNLRELDQMSEALQVYQVAADLVTRALTDEDIHVTPKNIRVYNSLSNMLREHAGDGPGALRYALKAVEVESEWENAHHSKANALVLLGRLAEAKVAFEKALKINPEFSTAHSNYGVCLEKMGLLELAETHLQRALQLNHAHMLTKFRLAALIIKLPKVSTQQLEQAEHLLLDVIEKEPDNGNATLSLGIVCADLGRLGDAEDYYMRAISISGHDRGVLYNFALLLSQQGRYTEAIEQLFLLLAQHPGDVSGRSLLGTSYLYSNQTALAAEAFQLALQQDPNNTMALNNYGFLCIKAKKNVQALELFGRLAELQPSNTAVVRQVEILRKTLDSN